MKNIIYNIFKVKFGFIFDSIKFYHINNKRKMKI